MGNSALAKIIRISPNKTSPRKHSIDTYSIHCMQGQLSAASCGALFADSKRKASSNYGIGKNGDMGLYVEEKDRSWCTSSSANDNRAITIEVASDSFAPYKVTDAAYKALIELLVDISKRNGIKKLVWSNNKYERVNHLNGVNMTVHRDYASKACPGDYLYDRMGEIAKEVNARLTPTPLISHLIYDYNFYKAKYPDLKAAGLTGEQALAMHFLQFGMIELRQGCKDFNPVVYKANNADLREAFGDNNEMYYQHYLNFGINENRIHV